MSQNLGCRNSYVQRASLRKTVRFANAVLFFVSANCILNS
ncbi:hypothetical protein LEP1GSC055_2502 [Leptospira borgpetersenii str. Brem 307]|nr:hypothetical protein LEP1GSC055_2502 [Leptospira borgpetersenii str. Brem 307]